MKPHLWLVSGIWHCAHRKADGWSTGPVGLGYNLQSAYADWASNYNWTTK